MLFSDQWFLRDTLPSRGPAKVCLIALGCILFALKFDSISQKAAATVSLYFMVVSCHILLGLYITTFEKQYAVLSIHNISGHEMAIIKILCLFFMRKKPKIT